MRGVGCFLIMTIDKKKKVRVSVPLRGVGCFSQASTSQQLLTFPSPCGVWVVSMIAVLERIAYALFPSPCGVWVVFLVDSINYHIDSVSVPLRGVGCFLLHPPDEPRQTGFRPLAGCGLFRQSCTFFLVQQEKELSTLLFYCIILADGLSIAN